MKKPPKYRHYKPKDLAVVWIDGKDHYLGPYESPESWERYHQLLAMRVSRGSIPAKVSNELSVSDMLLQYRKHAAQKYSTHGKPGKENIEMKLAARPLRQLFGSAAVIRFVPKDLKLIQRHLVESKKLSRRVINRRLGRIRRIFR